MSECEGQLDLPVAHEDFWDAIFDLVEKYDISVTNNIPKPGLPHITEFGEDVLRILSL